MTLQRRTIRFSDPEWDRVAAEARRLRMPTSEFVREAVLNRLGGTMEPHVQEGVRPTAPDGRDDPAERVDRTYTVKIEFTPPDL